MVKPIFLVIAIPLLLYNTLTFGQDNALIEAVKQSKSDRVQNLIRAGANPNVSDDQGATALMWAAMVGNFELVRFLVDHGANPMMKGFIPINNGFYGSLLAVAAGEGHQEILKYLIDVCGIQVNDKELDYETGEISGWTALQWGINHENIEVLKILIERGADPSSGLIMAAGNGHKEIVELLLRKGAEPKTKDENGAGPLHHAMRFASFIFKKEIANRQAEIVRLLLESGANINQRTHDGLTPLMYAAYWHVQKNMYTLLIHFGADINATDNSGDSVLHWAVKKSASELTQYIIEMGADVNVRGWEDLTPLHLAVIDENYDMVRLLLKADLSLDNLTMAVYLLGVGTEAESNWLNIETVRELDKSQLQKMQLAAEMLYLFSIQMVPVGLRRNTISSDDLLYAQNAVIKSILFLEQLRRTTVTRQITTMEHIITSLRKRYDQAIELYFMTSEENPEDKDWAFRISERARSRDYCDMVSLSALYYEYPTVKLWLSLRHQMISLEHYIDEGQLELSGYPIDIQGWLEETKLELERVRAEVAAIRPGLVERLEVEKPNVVAGKDAISAMIGADRTLIEYYITDYHIYIFVITPSSHMEIHKVPAPTAEVHFLTVKFVSKLSDPRQRQRPWKNDSRKLYQYLVEPIQHLLEDTPRLIIVPEGFLSLLPFETLIDRDGALLVDVLNSITYLPSANLLIHLDKGRSFNYVDLFFLDSPNENTALVVGIDEFNEMRNFKHSESEAKLISKAFGAGTKLLLGSNGNVTKDLLLNEMPKYNYLHFSTHGLINSKVPMFSHIVIKNHHGDDVPLTAFEILSQLIDARLVTLSACRITIGAPSDFQRSDIYFGLPRAFLYSGAENVINSLWNVDELATADLMQQFYHSLIKNPYSEIGIALVKAKRNLKKEYYHPYYWAPFILFGTE